MHLVALDEILVIRKVAGWIFDVLLDVIVQIPAEILIWHHEEQSKLMVSIWVQTSCSGELVLSCQDYQDYQDYQDLQAHVKDMLHGLCPFLLKFWNVQAWLLNIWYLSYR